MQYLLPHYERPAYDDGSGDLDGFIILGGCAVPTYRRPRVIEVEGDQYVLVDVDPVPEDVQQYLDHVKRRQAWMARHNHELDPKLVERLGEWAYYEANGLLQSKEPELDGPRATNEEPAQPTKPAEAAASPRQLRAQAQMCFDWGRSNARP